MYTLKADNTIMMKLATFSDAILAVMTIKQRPLFGDEMKAITFNKSLSFVSEGIRYSLTVEN